MLKSIVIPALIALLSAASHAQTEVDNREIKSDLADITRSDWRKIAPENLVLMDTKYGRIAIELNTDFAPNHSAHFKSLIRAGAYKDTHFYRVIDGFVAQGGIQDETIIETYPTIENENDRPISDAVFVDLGNPDLYAPIVGHIDGFAVGRSESLNKEWLLHCPKTIAMARDDDPDSGSTEFYIVLDAQRHLDRNLTVFGRVIDGMEYVQKLKRGNPNIDSGVIQAPEKGDAITTITVAADLDEGERPGYEVMASPSEAFETAKTAKRVRDHPFFYRKPPEVLDICGFDVPTRMSRD
jgi:peptidylprolyl isomerase